MGLAGWLARGGGGVFYKQASWAGRMDWAGWLVGWLWRVGLGLRLGGPERDESGGGEREGNVGGLRERGWSAGFLFLRARFGF